MPRRHPVLFGAVILLVFWGCRDDGPQPLPPRVPVGLMWGSGASGAMVEDTVPLVVFYRDSAGDPIGWNQPVVTWSSSNPAVLQILSDTLALALDTGFAVLTATTANVPLDTIDVAFEVIPRWQGRLVWSRQPVEDVQPAVATQEFPGHDIRQLPDLGYAGDASGSSYLTRDGQHLAAVARRPTAPRVTIYVIAFGTDTKTAPFDTLPGNQFRPVWLPGDTLLAFLTEAAGAYEVFTARPDGSNRLQRTHLGETQPPFFDTTPEGRLVIGLRAGARNADLFETTLDGTLVRRLTATPDDEYKVAVSPDGTMIAYDDGLHVWLRNRDGSEPRRLLPHRRTMAGFTPRPATALSNSPAWTPDNRFVLVAWSVDSFVRPDGQAYVVLGEIYAVRISDGLAIRLTRSHAIDAAPFFR